MICSVCVLSFVLLFFKQKTAYEMCISDWSSDVCSSDLNQYTALTGRAGQPGLWPMGVWLDQAPVQSLDETLRVASEFREHQWGLDTVSLSAPAPLGFQPDKPALAWDPARIADARETLAHCQSQIGRASCRERVCQYV